MIHFLWRINMNSSTPEKSPGTKSPYKTISSRFISTRLVSIFLFRSASSVQLTLVVVSMSVVNFHEIFAWNHVFYFVSFRFGVRTMRYIPGWHMHSILRWLDWIFWGWYLPTLSINYVGMSKDMEKRLPQLYYIKMKISYDLGFIAIGVAMAT